MSSASLRRTPSLQVVVPSPVGSVRVICPSQPHRTETLRPHAQRKRKVGEISSSTPAERLAMSTSIPSCSTSVPRSRPGPSLPQLEIPQYHPSPASAHSDHDSRCDGPPSPTATEIIDVEPEDFTRTAIRLGVKVRDYAYEPKSASMMTTPAKECWDPLISLLRHDIHIRKPRESLESHRVTGKDLWRLRESGWVTKEEADKHWSAQDWKEMEKYRDQPGGPYPYVIGLGRRKPTAAFRAQFRKTSLPFITYEVPEADIFVPADEPGMWTGNVMMEEDGELNENQTEAGGSKRAGKKRKVTDGSGTTSPLHTMLSATSRMLSRTPSISPSAVTSPSLSRTSSQASTSSPKKRTLRRNHAMVRVR